MYEKTLNNVYYEMESVIKIIFKFLGFEPYHLIHFTSLHLYDFRFSKNKSTNPSFFPASLKIVISIETHARSHDYIDWTNSMIHTLR